MTKADPNSKAMQGVIVAAQIAGALLAVYWLTRAVLGYVAPESLWTEPQEIVLPAPVASSGSRQNFNFGFDAFGRESTAPTTPRIVGEDAPETSLNLTLTGLRAGANGSAFLKTPDNKQGVYRVGEEVITGVTLESIAAHYIVLSVSGRLERLTFEREQENTLMKNIAVNNAGGTAPKAQLMSVSKLMSSVKINPVREGGSLIGYSISPRGGAVTLSNYGLQNGDVLTRVGNQDLTSGRPDIAGIIRNGNKPVQVSILRNGAPMTLTIGSR